MSVKYFLRTFMEFAPYSSLLSKKRENNNYQPLILKIMAKDIKLNSDKWCDVVFENKNKDYGAYKLRQTSSKRHMLAFGITVLTVGAIITIPMFLKAVQPDKLHYVEYNGPNVMSDIPKEDDKEEVIIPPQDVEPPKQLDAKTIAFPPPVIVDQVSEGEEMVDQSTLNDRNSGRIENFTFKEGSLDPNAMSRKQPTGAEVTSEGDGSGGEINKRFKVVEQMPQYPGGAAELFKFLNRSIKYPTVAAEMGIEGKVILTFVVEKDGSITDVKVARTLDPACDKEAIRVVKSMPKWIPGKQNGRLVRVEYTLPVTYKLEKM